MLGSEAGKALSLSSMLVCGFGNNYEKGSFWKVENENGDRYFFVPKLKCVC